jgi:ADP-L-glycero-D-manno-heptose 6-epimerase
LFDLAVVDRFVKKEKMPPHWVGLKFFNVYGPNEYHKGHMASVLAKVFDLARSGQPVRLFKSRREGVADGDQRRDFVYIDDAISVLRWLLDATGINGIFNVGTGKAESFRDMISAMFDALRRPVNIEYIDMPEAIVGQYQYFTEARTERLRRAGYNADFMPLEAAVNRYVTGYLNLDDRYR